MERLKVTELKALSKSRLFDKAFNSVTKGLFEVEKSRFGKIDYGLLCF